MILLGLMAPGLSNSQESDDPPIKYLRGRITGVSYTGSKVIVKWFYTMDNLSQDEIAFSVPSSVSISSEKNRIFDNDRRIGLVDLTIGNHVVIKYYADKKKDVQEAISIRVLDQDRPIPP